MTKMTNSEPESGGQKIFEKIAISDVVEECSYGCRRWRYVMLPRALSVVEALPFGYALFYGRHMRGNIADCAIRAGRVLYLQ
jgi:hypothetical protein